MPVRRPVGRAVTCHPPWSDPPPTVVPERVVPPVAPVLPVLDALGEVAGAPRLTAAMRLADDLRLTAAIAADGASAGAVAEALIDAVHSADPLTAIASIHALGAVPHPSVDDELVGLVRAGDEPFAGHAAWTLGARRPSVGATLELRALQAAGGFSGMLAERTLRSWRSFDSPVDPGAATAVVDGFDGLGGLGGLDGIEGVGRGSGIVVLQPFLHARIDRAGSSLGRGDAGGIASLLRSLGTSLAQVDGIDTVVTITRRHRGDAPTESLAPGHVVARVRVGGDDALPWREAWVHRVAVEQQLLALGRSLAHRRVVWHLRMADVGTLAAASAARRLGQPIVFTAAPDPHIVIDAMQDDCRLDRGRFGVEDAAAQYWFRTRMVERLAAQADAVVVLPRPTIEQELVELVGLSADDVRARVTRVPEGVDVAAIDTAFAARGAGDRVPAVDAVLDHLPPERRHLPWALTVGRLHPSKGAHRVVAAVAGSAALADAVNVVVVGGDLGRPTADEQSTIELVRRAAAGAHPALVTLTGNLPPDDVAALMVHVAATGGVYVGAADKEEFGLAIVEAMAAGAAVVAPARGGPRSYVDHGRTGVLCETMSVEHLRGAIVEALELAQGEGSRRRVDEVRAIVRRDLGIDSMARALAGVYERVTVGGRPATATTEAAA